MAKKPKPLSLTDRIRQEVHRRGWTAYRLAKESGVSESTALRLMKEEHDPTASNLDLILAALGWEIGPARSTARRNIR